MELPDIYYLQDLIKGTHNIIIQGNIYKYFTVLILYERYNLDNEAKLLKSKVRFVLIFYAFIDVSTIPKTRLVILGIKIALFNE